MWPDGSFAIVPSRRVRIDVHGEQIWDSRNGQGRIPQREAEDRVEIRRRVGAHQQGASPAIGETHGGRARERRLADTALPCKEVESNRMFDKVTQGAAVNTARGA